MRIPRFGETASGIPEFNASAGILFSARPTVHYVHV